MASSSRVKETEHLVPKIESLPNLRLLCTRSKESLTDDLPHKGAVYRSSKPDRITAEDVVLFRKLGIKSIVDFRSLDEYRKTDGLCFLDKEYSLYKVVLPKKLYTPEDEVETELITKSDVRNDPAADPSQERKHFLINFFAASYIVTAMKRIPWYMLFVGLFHAVYDFIKKNKFETFTTFFIKNSVNRGGIIGQYKDIVDTSGTAVCAALKLISNPENMPVLINCAHGKDRTGIMSALILRCLGMPEDYVMMEYSLSEKGLESIHHIMVEDMVEKLKLKEEFSTASAENMNELLTYIKTKYGSIQGYMTHVGFGPEDQQALCDNLNAFENQECLRIMRSGTAIDGSNVDVSDVLLH